MDNKQAVRAARKMIDRLQVAEGAMIADLEAFGYFDPEPVVGRTAKRMKAGFERLGITLNDFARGIRPIVNTEAKFSGGNPPPSWDQAAWAINTMQQIEAEL